MRFIQLILLITGLAGAVQAQQRPVLNFGIGSLGATVEAGFRLGDNLGIRGVGGYGRGAVSTSFNGAPVSGTATIGGYGVLADLYLGGGARLSAGALAPLYRADMAITGNITVNGFAFNNVDIAASVSPLRQVAPVLALGYEKSWRNNWGISADIGAMYMGGFSLSATDNSSQIPQGDLDAELAASNAELGQITILPYVKLGVSFQF